MPELPEVETIKRGLKARLSGRKILKALVKDKTVLTGISPKGGPFRNVAIPEFEKNTAGKEVSGFARRGKYLIMEFSDKSALIFHLRMTGQLTLNPPQGNERLCLFLSGGQTLCFTDRRRFGEVIFSARWRDEKPFQSLGIEPLNGKLTAPFLKKAFARRTSPIHSLLLNQTLVSGLGNIYVTEALFHAGILPTRPAGRISLDRLEKLASCIRQVLEKSIENRGYSGIINLLWTSRLFAITKRRGMITTWRIRSRPGWLYWEPRLSLCGKVGPT